MPGGKSKKFVGFENIERETSAEGMPYPDSLRTVFRFIILGVLFTKDAINTEYERSVFTILDAFGNIGGLLEIFSIIGGFMVGIFSEKLFFYRIFSRMYQVQEPEKTPMSNLRENNI